MTFLELYQTLLGFVFFKLFQSINLIYPPKLDFEKDEAGAGLGALLLEQSTQKLIAAQSSDPQPQLTVKEVRQQIKELVKKPVNDTASAEDAVAPGPSNALVSHPDDDLDTSEGPALFSNYYFFLSREVTRPMLEFVIRSFGGEVGWDPVLGAGSSFAEDDPRITHHVVDRPALPSSLAQFDSQRAFVQPQWAVDCVNQAKLLPTELYGPGKILPPHLSPFVDHEDMRKQGAYVPEGVEARPDGGAEEQMEEDDDEEDENEDDDDDDDVMQLDKDEDTQRLRKKVDSQARPALAAAARNPSDTTLLHAAEIEAEELGISHTQFETELKKARSSQKKSGATKPKAVADTDSRDINEAMLTGKQRKLYQKMTYTKQRRAEEVRFMSSVYAQRDTGSDIAVPSITVWVLKYSEINWRQRNARF